MSKIASSSLCSSILVRLMLACMLCSPLVVLADKLGDWRTQLGELRVLAENDAPAAYREVRRLQVDTPVEVTSADQARIFNLRARIELYLGLIEESAQHSAEARLIAKQNHDPVGQIEADLVVSSSAINQGRLDDMKAAVQDAMDLLEEVKREDLRAEVMFHVAMMYLRFGHLDEAVTVSMQSLDIAKRDNNPLALAYAMQGMAVAYSQSGLHQQSHEYFQKMRDAAQQAHSGLLEAAAILGMGELAGASQNFGEAIRITEQAVALFRQAGAPLYVAHAVFLLADLNIKAKQLGTALGLLDGDVALYEKHNNPIGLWWTLTKRSYLLQLMGRPGAARRDAERANELAQKIGFTVYLAGSARRLADMAAAEGQYQQAYRYSAEAAQLNEKLEAEKASRRILDMSERFQRDSKQRQIESLTLSGERQNARQRQLWTVLGATLALLTLTAYFVLRLRRSSEEIRKLNIGLEQRVQERTEELQQSRESLAEAQRIAHVGSWQMNLVDNVLSWSDEVFRIFEVDRRKFGASYEAFMATVHPDDRERLDQVYKESLQNHRSFEIEHRLLLADGRIKYVHERCETIYDAAGKPLQSIGTVQDITELKQIEAAREAALAEARRLAHARSEFLAQMSHELRTPLNGILGYAQILLRDQRLDARQHASLNVVKQSGEHLLTLINDILDFAKVDSGKMELIEGDINLDKFIAAIAGIMRIKADEKRLEFVCDTAPGLPGWIHVDEKRLRQVLLNLLSNAIKFTERGSVRLNVLPTAEGKVRFEVRDTGSGIQVDQLERIFQPFEQVGDHFQHGGGTGLGLPISRQCVRLMGGDIQVQSLPGQGSTFWFELAAKASDVAAGRGESVRKVLGYAGPRKSILIADDVDENRVVAVEFLSALGFRIEEARNGQEILALVQAQRPDLVLTDIVMPLMDGLEATRKLRSMAGLEQMPVIAMSASASGDDEALCNAAGADAFLPKPLAFDALLEAIGRLLKLEWQYEQRSTSRKAEQEWILPPQEALESLRHLAELGNVSAIVEQAEQLAAADERYQPFTGYLLELAQGYQTRAILAFVEAQIKRGPQA